jgi:hypothetical protein
VQQILCCPFIPLFIERVGTADCLGHDRTIVQLVDVAVALTLASA